MFRLFTPIPGNDLCLFGTGEVVEGSLPDLLDRLLAELETGDVVHSFGVFSMRTERGWEVLLADDSLTTALACAAFVESVPLAA